MIFVFFIVSGTTDIYTYCHTLSLRDALPIFLGLAKMAPALAAYAGDRDRGRIKAASVKEFLKGVPRVQLEADAEAFAGQVWPGFMRYDALARWKDWGEKGAHRVIVTASPETTVAPFARRLGAPALLDRKSTRLNSSH